MSKGVIVAVTSFRKTLLGATILFGLGTVPAFAQTAPSGGAAEGTGDEIVVTATRRQTTLQDAPINISAISPETLSRQRIDDVRGLAAFTPGLTIADTGPASTGNVILRGISSADTAGGTNAQSALGIYLGEVPLYLDFKLIDLARVEVLQGPQGTLYGLGTLSGAIRYMPNRPNTDRISLEYHGRYFGVAHGSNPGVNGDATFNLPIVADHIAFRTATGYYDNPGFIDYPYLLKQPGVSNPQPVRGATAAQGSFGTPADYAANFYRRKDLNYERTFTTRNQLLLQASPDAKLFLTYAHQTTDTGGQQSNGAGVLGTGRYEAPWRYAEPRSRKADLYAAELNLGLGGIADLVATAALTNQRNRAQSDNTDLLLDLDYGYEAFPAFSSYNTNETIYRQFNGEVRLVSTHGGPFSWVIGGFYNNQRQRSQYREYVPGYPEFAGINRPDALEYMSFINTRTKEKAVYGEGTLNITDAWQVTGGLRYYKYDAFAQGGTDTPLFSKNTPYPLVVFAPSRIKSGDTSADGFVWKANTSYKFSDALLAYATYSTGYRPGNVNRVAPCILPLPAGQNVCALPNELSYQPDKTRNAEIGVRSALFDKRLQLTASIYRIDWKGIQIPSQTVNGAVGIIVNGSEARSQGFDVSAVLRPVPRLTLQGTYAYVDAKLTKDAPGVLVSQGQTFGAFAGDRLPGSAKHTASGQATYTQPLDNGADIEATWATAYIGDIYSRTGLRANGEAIPGYVTHRASITYRTDRFDIGVFGDNLFDKYAVTSVSNDRSSFNQVRTGVVERYYSYNVLTPRRLGVDFRVRY